MRVNGYQPRCNYLSNICLQRAIRRGMIANTLHNRQRGAHLLELLVALALVTLVSSIAAPVMRQFSQAGGLRREADNIKRFLELASVMASQHEMTVMTSISQQQITLDNAANRGDTPLIHSIPNHFQLAGKGEEYLKFFPSGAATPATLELRNNDRICFIIISLRGRIRVQC